MTGNADKKDSAQTVQMLFVEHLPALRGFLHALVSDFSYVDEVVQETFLTVNKKAGDFEVGSNFLAWIYTIARLKVLENARYHRKGPRPFSPEVLEALSCDCPKIGNLEEKLQRLENCLSNLSKKMRNAINLRYLESKTPCEIGNQLGWTTESVHVILSRSRRNLRECVKRQH